MPISNLAIINESYLMKKRKPYIYQKNKSIHLMNASIIFILLFAQDGKRLCFFTMAILIFLSTSARTWIIPADLRSNFYRLLFYSST